MKPLKKIAIPFLGLAALVCAAASADQPTTRPVNGNYTNRQVNGLSRALFGRNTGIVPPTPEEWEDMMQFMRKYSHARAHVMDNLKIDPDSPIALQAVRRWRNYVFASEHFPEIKEDLLRRIQLEDDLFELTLRDRAEEGAETIELQSKIRDKVTEIVTLEFAVRQARIDQLQKMLADEKNRLQHDQAAADTIIDQRTEKIILGLQKWNPNLAPPTSRPDDPSPVDNLPPSESHNALLNLSAQPDSAGK
jgi:hypothetical protein